MHLEGDRHIEYCQAFLYRYHAAGREALPIPNAVHFIKDWRIFFCQVSGSNRVSYDKSGYRLSFEKLPRWLVPEPDLRRRFPTPRLDEKSDSG